MSATPAPTAWVLRRKRLAQNVLVMPWAEKLKWVADEKISNKQRELAGVEHNDTARKLQRANSQEAADEIVEDTVARSKDDSLGTVSSPFLRFTRWCASKGKEPFHTDGDVMYDCLTETRVESAPLTRGKTFLATINVVTRLLELDTPKTTFTPSSGSWCV